MCKQSPHTVRNLWPKAEFHINKQATLRQAAEQLVIIINLQHLYSAQIQGSSSQRHKFHGAMMTIKVSSLTDRHRQC